MGRERFAELLERLWDIQRRHDRSALWVYGTKGYGKSHLLAALVCFLSARKEKVVYIPDCREYVQDPVRYLQMAMLFAWADDDNIQREIIGLDTWKKIDDFFQSCKNIIFVIDQMNALELDGDEPEIQQRGGRGSTFVVRSLQVKSQSNPQFFSKLQRLSPIVTEREY